MNQDTPHLPATDLAAPESSSSAPSSAPVTHSELPQKPPAARKKSRSAAAADSMSGSGSAQEALPQPLTQSRRRAGNVPFYTSRTSIFADGYDIERERLEVLPLINAAGSGQSIECLTTITLAG